MYIMMSLLKNLIPQQYTGSKTGATAKYTATSRHNAIALFNEAKIKLLDINHWYKVCGGTGAEFLLTDQKGNAMLNIPPQVGHLIKIKLPAPSNSKGHGFDWVRIEKIENKKDLVKDEELFGFRVRPVDNPEDRSSISAHFYTKDATSSFIIMRRGLSVYALERGRNELPNATGGLKDKIRNFGVAFLGMIGFSKPQWKKLVNGFLQHN
jgi:hypothetical protein